MKNITSFTQFLKEDVFDTQYFTESEQTYDVDLNTQFFFLTRNCATQSHYLHLITESRSDHIALEKFYTEIIDLLDIYIEAYQGKFGKLSNTMPTNTPYLAISEFRGWIEDNRNELTDASELQNIIDEIISFCDGILYQLENLK